MVVTNHNTKWTIVNGLSRDGKISDTKAEGTECVKDPERTICVCGGGIGNKKGREEEIFPYRHIYILGAQGIFISRT